MFDNNMVFVEEGLNICIYCKPKALGHSSCYQSEGFSMWIENMFTWAWDLFYTDVESQKHLFSYSNWVLPFLVSNFIFLFMKGIPRFNNGKFLNFLNYFNVPSIFSLELFEYSEDTFIKQTLWVNQPSPQNNKAKISSEGSTFFL